MMDNQQDGRCGSSEPPGQRAFGVETASAVSSIAATPNAVIFERAFRALDRSICFSAYSAQKPLSIRFDFACADDRLAAANALDDAFEALPDEAEWNIERDAEDAARRLGFVPASAAGGRSPETNADSAQPEGRQSGGGEASATPNQGSHNG